MLREHIGEASPVSLAPRVTSPHPFPHGLLPGHRIACEAYRSRNLGTKVAAEDRPRDRPHTCATATASRCWSPPGGGEAGAETPHAGPPLGAARPRGRRERHDAEAAT